MTRLIAPLALALLVSCSSSTDLIDTRYLGCEPGQDVSISAGLNAPLLHEDGTEDRFNVLVEVSNNSHDEITVKVVGVDQHANETTGYTVDRGYGEYDQVIPPGKDHTFELPMHGRAVRSRERAFSGSRALELAVTVILTNGDQYRCSFDVGARR